MSGLRDRSRKDVEVGVYVEWAVTKQNVTLALPKQTLKKLKILAIHRDTSLSGLLTNCRERMVAEDEAYRRARAVHLELLDRGFDMGTGGKL